MRSKRIISFCTVFISLLTFNAKLLTAYDAPLEFTSETPLNAAVRSLLVPGWGQIFNGQKTKGHIILASEVALVAGATAMYMVSENTYKRYEASSDPDDPLYDTYTRQVNAANILVLGACLLWGYNVADAYLSSPSRRRVSIDMDRREIRFVYRF